MAQHLHQQPSRVAAGAGLFGQGFLRRLDAGLHADGVGDFARDGRVQVEDEVGGLPFLARHLGQEGVELFAQGRGFQIGLQLRFQVGGIGEGKFFRLRLQEKVEGIDHFHLDRQLDGHGEVIDLLGKHHPRQPVGLRVLLPVQEMVFGFNLQRIGDDLGAGVRRRAQADGLRPQRDRPVIAIAGDVAQRGLNAH